MRIGIFGGTFDPIHLGHLIMAQDAMETGNLDRVLFLPAGAPPLKMAQPATPPSTRLEMVDHAIADNPHFTSDDSDLLEDRPSYSVDAVRRLKLRFPKDEIFWILGADQLAQLDKWRNVETLVREVEFIALGRPGVELDRESIPPHTRFAFATTHAMNISSSEIRQRLRNGQSVKYFLHPAVLDYIKARNLYL